MKKRWTSHLALLLAAAIMAMSFAACAEGCAHESSSWKTLQAATCASAGQRVRSCDACRATLESAEIPRLSHSFGEWTRQAEPTCTQTGSESRACAACGQTETRAVSALGHQFGGWAVTTPAGCEKPGARARACSRCGVSESETLPALQHQWSRWRTTKAATCTEEGRQARTCENCGKTRIQTLEKTGHAFGDWRVVKAPDGDAPGLRERVCAACGETEEDEFYFEGALCKGDQGEAVKALQQALNEAGYDCGEPDGVFDGDTEEAVKRFQADCGLEIDGQATPALLIRLTLMVSGLQLSLSTDAALLEAAPGDAVDVCFSVVNASDYYINVNKITGGGASDSCDFSPESEEMRRFAPGARAEIHARIQATENDAALGVARRTVKIRGFVWEDGEIGGIEAESNELVLEIPLRAKPTVTAPDEPAQNPTDENPSAAEEVVPPVTIPAPETADAAAAARQSESAEALEQLSEEDRMSLRAAEAAEVILEKTIESAPANGKYYEEGEVISFRIRLVNNGNEDIYNVVVVDPMKSSGNRVAYLNVLEAGSACRSLYEHRVSAADVKRGAVVNQAMAYWTNDGDSDKPTETVSNTVTAPTREREMPENDLIILKKATSEPANGSFYVAGEKICYRVEIINSNNREITDFSITDSLAKALSAQTIPAGNRLTLDYEYEVTEDDALSGSVENVVTCTWRDNNQQERAVSSAPVVLTTGVEESPRAERTLTVSKRAANKPANGSFFVAGESIEYVVDISNPFDHIIGNAVLYDPLVGGDIACGAIAAGGSIHFQFKHKVTEDEAALGYIENDAVCRWKDEFGNEQSASSNIVRVPTGAELPASSEAAEEPVSVETPKAAEAPVPTEAPVPSETPEIAEAPVPAEAPEMAEAPVPAEVPGTEEIPVPSEVPEAVRTESAVREITVVKSVLNTPANGLYYTEGEEVIYGVEVFNANPYDVFSVRIEDALLPEPLVIDLLPAGEMASVRYFYTVTGGDAREGSIQNTAECFWTDEAGYVCSSASNTIVSATGIGNAGSGLLTVSQAIVGEPENGLFYVPGEDVTCSIAVRNETDAAYTDLVISDPRLAGDGVVGVYDIAAPGFAETLTYAYTVTDIDAATGRIVGIPCLAAVDEGGNERLIPCAPVGADAGFEGGRSDSYPFARTPEVELVMRVAGGPQNGVYYTAGETAVYLITCANVGDTPIERVVISDSLLLASDGSVKNGFGGQIYYAERLNPGQSASCEFRAVVTENDERCGFVTSAAVARYDIGGYSNVVMSNEVVLQTDAQAHDAESGFIAAPILLGTEAANYSPCACVPASRNGDGAQYEARFCSVHVSTQNLTNLMLNLSRPDEMKLWAWKYARAQWQDDLNDLYAALLEASDSAAKQAVLYERAEFSAMLASREAALNALYPNDPIAVAQKMAEAVMNECADLCLAIHTAPKGGQDRLSFTEANAVSGLDANAAGEGSLTLACRMTDSLLIDGSTVETWRRVAELWQNEMKAVGCERISGLDAPSRTAILADCAAFERWVDAREALLRCLYPDNPEYAAETAATTFMSRVLELYAMR